MAAGCRECELIKELIAERADVGAHVATFLLDGHLPTPRRHDDALISLGGSMVGGAVPTAAAPPAMAHTPAPDRLETRGSTASRLAERRDGLLPEVAPAQLAPRGQVPQELRAFLDLREVTHVGPMTGRPNLLGKVPGRTSRPQAVPPRPGVRDPLRASRDHICPRRRSPEAVLATIRRLVAEVTGIDARDVAVARSTSFDADLEMESHELVVLGRRIREAYGPEVDVPAWFGELDIDDLVTLTAGDVTDFVVWCLDP